jgi:acetyl esterase/lipase
MRLAKFDNGKRSILSAFFFLTLIATLPATVFAQSASAPQLGPSSAPAAQKKTSETGSAPTVSSTPPNTPKTLVPPGIDSKTGIPLYETIQEDWSSLQPGASKLQPEPPLVGQVEDQDGFTRSLVQVKWRPGDPIDLWIVLPKGVTKPPVVLYLYGADQGTARFRDNAWCKIATSDGVAAVGFVAALTGPRFHDRPMKQWIVSELQEAVGSTVHDVRFILDYLAQRGDVDMSRIGMFGEGSGGTVAILAAASDARIKVVDTLEPWGDWSDFLAKSPIVEEDPNHAEYVKPEFLKKVAPLDPVKWLPELKTPIRIQLVRETEVTPLEVKEKIGAAAPKQAEVVHFAAVSDLTTREAGNRLFRWMKDRLKELPPPSSTKSMTDASVASGNPPTKMESGEALHQ